MSIATFLTMSRVATAACFGAYVVAVGSAASVTVLLGLALCVEVTDLLDGPVARRRGTASPTTAVFDTTADQFSRTTIVACLTTIDLMPLWLLLVMLSRDSLLYCLRLVLLVRSVSAPTTRFSGKAKGVAQGGTIILVLGLAAAGSDFPREPLFLGCGIVTGISAIDYLSNALRQLRVTGPSDPR